MTEENKLPYDVESDRLATLRLRNEEQPEIELVVAINKLDAWLRLWTEVMGKPQPAAVREALAHMRSARVLLRQQRG
jgi:hypothetical protein